MSPSLAEITSPFIRQAIKTPFNIAPERSQALADEIFKNKKWAIEQADGEANFYANPAETKLLITQSGIASLWCLAFAGYFLINAASIIQRLKPKQHQIDLSQIAAEMRLGEYLAYSKSLFHVSSPWPQGLIKPNIENKLDSPEGRVNNIFFGALSWIILHEIAHVHHNDEILIPASQRVKQEFRADSFATKWVLSDCGNGLESEFRILAISIAFTWLFLQEREMGQGATHPAVILRFREAIEFIPRSRRSVGLEASCYLFKAILDPKTVAPIFQYPSEQFEWIAQRLEQLFPIKGQSSR